MKTKHWVFLGAILLPALGLRLYKAGSREIFYDDAFSYFLAQQSLGKIIAGTAADTMPPLYYFLLHFWMKLGDSIFVLRLLGVVLSLGMIAVVFDLGRRLAGVAAGLWAALIVAVAPFQIYHAQELRMYPLLGLAQISYVWFFVRLREQGPDKTPVGLWAGLVLTGTAAMYSHNLAIFGLILPDVYLLLKRDWRMLLKLVLAQLIIALFAAPWLVMIPVQIDKIQTAFSIPRPGVVEVLQGLLQFHIFLPMDGAVMLLATLFSLQAMVLIGFESFKARKTPGVGFLSLLWIGLPVLLFAVSYVMRPIFVPRGFILSMLAYAILGGWMISRRWVKSIGPYLAGACILASLISLPAFYRFSEFPRSEFRNATAFLRQNAQTGDVILHDNKLSYFPSHFYDPSLEQTFLPDDPGGHNDTYAVASQEAMIIFPSVSVEQATAHHERVWFVVFTRAIQEYAEAGVAIHPVMAQLDTQYDQISQIAFGDLEIYLYQR
ncbi:MAG TPA: glycosyltransferase family 39 protein [Bellilinea sp.]|nr:glycosyltransferase family 39 protein [Bellilinea sp.]